MGTAGSICALCGTSYESSVLFCPRDGTPLGTREFAEAGDRYVGLMLPGQVRIEKLVGTGSMGRVYRAFQGGIEREVAVKILRRELSGNSELVARFHREARVASMLVHPHVVQVFMAGQIPPLTGQTDGAMYIVMEYLDGISLKSALAAAGGSFGAIRALRLALAMCDAVGEAHAQQIVHRDLKPENVMLIRRGADPDFVKVLDFGIARMQLGNAPHATQAGMVFGTARYMSPEAANGERVGPPSDVYAIATMLYQMLAGRTPFEGESAMSLLFQQVNEPPPPLSSVDRARYLPAPLCDLVLRNLCKNPQDRFPTARALGRALLRTAESCGFPGAELIETNALAAEGPGPLALRSLQPTRALQSFDARDGRASGGLQVAETEQARPASNGGGRTAGRGGTLPFLLGCFVGGAALALAVGFHFAGRGEMAASAPDRSGPPDAGVSTALDGSFRALPSAPQTSIPSRVPATEAPTGEAP